MRKKLNIFMAAMVLCMLACPSCTKTPGISQKEYSTIVDRFQSPADDNTVWCYWYWINDDISREGITKDLEAMKQAGIGAAFIGNINPAHTDGKVPLFSEEWWNCMVHAVVEGARIGVDIGTFNCPGWSQSGGPWVTPEMAMRYLTYSEARFNGPGKTDRVLARPADEFQDTHTLAFRLPDSEGFRMKEHLKQITSGVKGVDLRHLADGDTSTIIQFDRNNHSEAEFVFEFERTITARKFSITPAGPLKCQCELYAAVDGREQLLSSFLFDRSKLTPNVGPVVLGELALALPETRSDKFRLVCKNFEGNQRNVAFSEVDISEAVVLDRFIEKQLGKMHPTPLPEWNSYVWNMQPEVTDPSMVVGEVLDISDRLDSTGRLVWDVPEGAWAVMRVGMTPTGTKNAPTAPQGEGYEIDKMSRELVKVHFDRYVGELLRRIPEESRKAFKYVIADSYEMGSQNWTDGFEVRFRETYGYDPVKYLPVLSGRVVGSVEASERFLWDLRRAVADDVAYEYVGGLRDVANAHGLQLWLENYGHWGFPSEFMMYGGQSDLISGEFWNEGTLGDIECKASSSTSHTYGKGRTSAEAFTASNKAYLRHPALLKRRGDWSFTEGINHLVLHLYIHQPDDGRVPGMNAWFSTEFNRHNTWFSQSHHYIDYLRRCQHLLQQGRYVADVCYFIGESAPIMTGGRDPEIPRGYSYDYINAEVILERLSVEDGRFVLPDGMSYRVMVLPPLKTMRPEVLTKIGQLVAQGGVVLGSPPEKSPGMQGYPRSDETLRELANALWGGAVTDGKMQHPYGAGMVFQGYDLPSVFEELIIEKDVETGDAPVLWTHRSLPGMEIYFITNQSDEEIFIEPSFRVSGLKPQLWDAVTGEIRYLEAYTAGKGRTQVPLTMEPHRSWFVVFTDATNAVIRPAGAANFPEFSIMTAVEGPWTVDFVNKAIGPQEPVIFDQLTDWSESLQEEIRYYSGTAVYRTTIVLEELPENREIYIDLGRVAVMAGVKVNGRDAGGVWIAPFRLNVSELLKAGENRLEIEVVNLWRNRMIRDKGLPESERYTWTVVGDMKSDETLHPSGLLGPVTLTERR